MTRYVAMIDGKAGSFGIVFPDLPGCVAMGTTMDEVIQFGTEVLSEWVSDVRAEGLKVPKARTIEQLLKDRDVQADLAGGAIFVSIPLIVDSGRSTRANISIDEGLLAAIDEAANKNGITRSAFLAAAARDKIKASA